ncbi:hypothetical protein KP509_32G063200 [Ceratopteris richardii]|uniref:Wings apart-like protein C-terminal domain-containing protein n=1 Tax=Ceratopteris richardii TaxID=49495 RepID=A0A8T2QUK5_CERRI|nr:hypothetical protein KP509_32G063200 [Ceratopteris richardii]KAH7287578.1 hypothetical protein KP509_32G063200 [Ceratopteris richardii]
MIVRTYKRRSRADVLGSQASAGDEDNELGCLSQRSYSMSRLSQTDDSDEPNPSLWSSLPNDRSCFSLPSSQGSSGIDSDDIRFSSLPARGFECPHEVGQGTETLPSDSDNFVKGKFKKTVSTGQKLIRAEGLLKRPKTISSANMKPKELGSSRSIGYTKSAGGDVQTQTRATGSSVDSYHVPMLGSTDSVIHSFSRQTSGDKSNMGSGSLDIQARALSAIEGGQLKDISASGQILNIIGPSAPCTSTLLEAQESGEMMEHVDEANFALDGLRPGQALSVCRASLVSLLSIFGTRQHRHLLRTHGMVRPVLDALLTVPTDDPATALGAATLLYVIAHDGQDENFLESSACIHFLMKLLSPACALPQDNRLSLLGSRLVSLGSQYKSNKVEVGSVALDKGGQRLVNKVKDVLSTMKGQSDGGLKFDCYSASFTEGAGSELLVLLILERGCLSTLVLEDNASSVRRIGGNFKERLRELGGLNAVCELAASCFSTLKKINMNMDYQHQCELLNGSKGVGLLLRCLKVMENVTFLSENNQKFLLDMMLSKNGVDCPRTFLEVVIGTINVTSDFIWSRTSGQSALAGEQSKKLKVQDSSLLDKASCKSGSEKKKNAGRNSQGSKGKGTFEFDDGTDSDDNVSIDQISKKQRSHMRTKEEVPNSSLQGKEKCSSLLEDCLLSAVKVIMNLTNDNELGCRRVAIVGGLDAMASLIVKLFPSFHSFPSDVPRRDGGQRDTKRVNTTSSTNAEDQDLDLLVVILGVLVNLVEKDTRNRGRLVSMNTEVLDKFLDGHGMHKEHSIIKLLCSIFLSKQGAGRVIESNKGNPDSEVDVESSLIEGQQEAEDMIVEAYSALLLAFLSKESWAVRSTIAEHLPERSLKALVPVLERFLVIFLLYR